MTLRFIPRLKAQLHTVREAQHCLGRDVTGGRLPERLGNAAAMLSILLTWALEDAMETADSMRSRGYGLPGRTSFSVFRFRRRDGAALGWLLLCGGYAAAGWASGVLTWRYYPTIRGTPGGLLPASFHLAYLALCLTPVILSRREERRWTRLRSGI
jgi:energy-coupling factor transport system permease protein